MQQELRLQTRHDRQRQRGQQENSEQRQQRLDRLRTRNRSVAQDLLMACNDDKEFSIYVETCYLSLKNSFTDLMKLNVQPTNYHTHIIMLKLIMISNYVWIAMSTRSLCRDT